VLLELFHNAQFLIGFFFHFPGTDDGIIDITNNSKNDNDDHRNNNLPCFRKTRSFYHDIIVMPLAIIIIVAHNSSSEIQSNQQVIDQVTVTVHKNSLIINVNNHKLSIYLSFRR
jgi:hypothetical protein